MKTLEKGHDKIKSICDMLRTETIDPAKREAEAIIIEARSRAEKMLKAAHEDVDTLLRKARDTIEQEKRVFESSLKQAARQSCEQLRQDVEGTFFAETLHDFVINATKKPSDAASLINTLVKAIEKEGLDGDLSVIIPAAMPAEKVNALLLDDVSSRIKEGEVILGSFNGGVKVRLHDKRLVIDMSDEALKELLGSYLRKDFREILFKS